MVHAGARGLDAAHQQFGDGGRRLRRMRDQVEHRLVALVADADDDLQRVSGDGEGDVAVVEPREVGARTAAAHDAQDVEVRGVVGEPLQAGEHRRLQLGALHLDRHERHVEAAARFLQVAEEVVPAVGVGAGQHADAQRRQREAELAVAFVQAELQQFAQHLFARQRQLAERERRVDVLRDDLQAAGARVVVELDQGADLDAVAQRQRRLVAFEGGQQAFGGAAEERDLDDGDRAHFAARLLDQLEEAMRAASTLVEVDDLAADPERAREQFAQPVADGVVELADRQRRRTLRIVAVAARGGVAGGGAQGQRALARRGGDAWCRLASGRRRRRAQRAGQQRRDLGGELEQVTRQQRVDLFDVRRGHLPDLGLRVPAATRQVLHRGDEVLAVREADQQMLTVRSEFDRARHRSAFIADRRRP